MLRLLILALFLFSGFSVYGQASEANAVSTVKKLVLLIRYKQNDKALALIDTKTFSKNLLINNWDSISTEDQVEFENAMKGYLKNKSFPQALEYFDKIDINYEKPVAMGKQIKVGSSILYKGSENVTFAWVLNESGGKLLISDFILKSGKLASEVNREKQIQPAFEKKGIKELIEMIKKASK